MNHWKIPVFLFCVCLLPHVHALDLSIENALKEGYAAYEKGLKASQLQEQQRSFQLALKLLQPVANNCVSSHLFLTLGNIYYQLEQYPWAILSYYRALHINPGNRAARQNLKQLLEEQKIIPIDFYPFWSHFFVWQKISSVKQMVMVISYSFLLVFFFASLWLWLKKEWMKKFFFALSIIWIYLASNLIYHQYGAPTEGVVIQPTFMRLGPGDNYAKINTYALSPGSKVIIEEEKREGDWIVIQLPSLGAGYVLQDSIGWI